MEEISGYDDVDADQVFNGGYIGENKSGEGRRRGKKPLASRSAARRSRTRRPAGRRFSVSWRGFEDTAKMMLAVSIGALVLCALILYATFGLRLLPDFYGALAASLVVMALLFYTAMKLVRGGR